MGTLSKETSQPFSPLPPLFMGSTSISSCFPLRVDLILGGLRRPKKQTGSQILPSFTKQIAGKSLTVYPYVFNSLTTKKLTTKVPSANFKKNVRSKLYHIEN